MLSGNKEEYGQALKHAQKELTRIDPELGLAIGNTGSEILIVTQSEDFFDSVCDRELDRGVLYDILSVNSFLFDILSQNGLGGRDVWEYLYDSETGVYFQANTYPGSEDDLNVNSIDPMPRVGQHYRHRDDSEWNSKFRGKYGVDYHYVTKIYGNSPNTLFTKLSTPDRNLEVIREYVRQTQENDSDRSEHQTIMELVVQTEIYGNVDETEHLLERLVEDYGTIGKYKPIYGGIIEFEWDTVKDDKPVLVYYVSNRYGEVKQVGIARGSRWAHAKFQEGLAAARLGESNSTKAIADEIRAAGGMDWLAYDLETHIE